MIPIVPEARRLSLPLKLVYGFGSLAYGIKDNGFSTLLLLFYNQVVGLPAELVGLAIFAALVLDAGIDPLVGALSDRIRSPWGRRHPFMYAAAVPVGLLYLLLWNPPRGAGRGELVSYLVVTAVLVRTAISCYEVPSSALAPELTTDYHERTSVLGYRFFFGWVGGMGMLLLAFGVFLAPTAHYPVGQLNPGGYRRYAVVASVLMTGAILISALGTHREIRRLPRLPPHRLGLGGTVGALGKTLKNRAFAVLLASGLLTYTLQGLNFALSTYFNTFLWVFPAATLALFTLAVLCGVGLAFGFATAASRRWGKRNSAVWATVAYIMVASAPLLLRYFRLLPENGAPLLLAILILDTLVAAMLGVGGAILGSSMMSDVVEDHQVRTGERQEGVFFAGSFFMQKCVSGLGLFLSGAILSAVGFPSRAAPGHVPAAVLDHLILVYVCSTVALGLAGAAVLSRFPLTEADHLARLADLAEAARLGAALPASENEAPAAAP